MKILLIAEHDNKLLKSSNYHTVSAAKQLGCEIDLLIVGYQCDSVIKQAQKLADIKKNICR